MGNFADIVFVLVFGGIISACFLAILYVIITALRREKEQWQRAVVRLEEALGSDRVEPVDGQKAVFLQVAAGTVRAEPGFAAAGARRPDIVRMSTGPSRGRLIRGSLSSRNRSVVNAAAGQGFTPNMRTGDPLFDAAVGIRGRQGEVLGRLDAETRAMLVRAVAIFDLRLEDGLLFLELPAASIDARTVDEAASTLAELVSRLTHDEAVPSRLESLARTDPEAGVREAAAKKLLGGWLKGARAEALATHLLGDEEPRIRLFAAGQGTAGSVQVLRDLADDEGVSLQVRLAALGRLVPEVHADLLRELLTSPSEPVRRAAAQALGLIDGTDVGRVSLSEGDEGALSLQPQAGAVALAS